MNDKKVELCVNPRALHLTEGENSARGLLHRLDGPIWIAVHAG